MNKLKTVASTENGRRALVTAAGACIAVICACALNPLFTYISSDIVYIETVLPTVLDLFISLLADIIMPALLLSAAVISVYLSRASKQLWLGAGIAAAVFVIYHIINLIFSGITGSFRAIDSMDVFSTAVYTAADLAVLLAGVLVSKKKTAVHFEKADGLERAHARLGTPYCERETVYPFKKFVSTKSPVLSGMLASAIVLASFSVGSRLIWDFFMGLPTSAGEVLEMIFGYSEDLIQALLVYTLAYFIFQFIFGKSDKNTSRSAADIKEV